jgi:hypothetical protein
MLVPSALIVQPAIAVVRAQMIPTMKSMSKSVDDLGNGNELSSRKLLDMLQTDHKKHQCLLPTPSTAKVNGARPMWRMRARRFQSVEYSHSRRLMGECNTVSRSPKTHCRVFWGKSKVTGATLREVLVPTGHVGIPCT